MLLSWAQARNEPFLPQLHRRMPTASNVRPYYAARGYCPARNSPAKPAPRRERISRISSYFARIPGPQNGPPAPECRRVFRATVEVKEEKRTRGEISPGGIFPPEPVLQGCGVWRRSLVRQR